MKRFMAWSIVAGYLIVSGANFGCMGRAISEGVGVVTGASGKVINIAPPGKLVRYKGLKLESLTVTEGLKVPPNIVELIRENMSKVAAKKKLSPSGTPCLVLTGEIMNYETADVVDTAIGPLEECFIRAKLVDADSQEVLAVANLVSRAKSTSSGGAKNLAEGIGKSLSKWLKAGGITSDGDEKDEED